MMQESVSDVLRSVEGEFRNQYWRIRNARRTDWKAVNRVRVLAEVMRLCGIPAEAIKEARYCLRVRVCKRCAGKSHRCHELTERALRGEFS
jgi:hypothetical protein